MNRTHEQAFTLLKCELDGGALVERAPHGRKRSDGRMNDLFLIAALDGVAHWFHCFFPKTAPEKASYLRLRDASTRMPEADIGLADAIALGKTLPAPPYTVAALVVGAPEDGDRYVGLVRHPGMPEPHAVALILNCLPQCGATLGLVD